MAVAVPAPAATCCHGGTEFATCSHAATKKAAEPAGCCQKSAAHNLCGGTSDDCYCCRPADPRTANSDRIADRLPPAAAVAFLPASRSTVDARFLGECAGDQPAGYTAIPHRILHCSWLI